MDGILSAACRAGRGAYGKRQEAGQADTSVLDAAREKSASAQDIADLLTGQKNPGAPNGQLNESSNRDTVDSTEARVQKAIALKENGAAANQIFNETGLVLVNNGSLVDGESGSVVGSVHHDIQGNPEFSKIGETVGSIEAENEDGRGIGENSYGNLEHGKDWENIGESARQRIVSRVSEIVNQQGNEDIIRIANGEGSSGLGAANAGFAPYPSMQNQYGNLPEGETPARQIDTPARTAEDNRVSLIARTVQEAALESRIPTIEQAVVDGKLPYVPVRNADAGKRAYFP